MIHPRAVTSPSQTHGNLRLVPNTAPLRSSNEPQFLFRQPLNDLRCHIPNTHEAGASVPRLSAQTGAASYSIPLAGLPAPLPSLFFKAVDSAHRILSFVSSIRRGLETNSGGLHEAAQVMFDGAQVMSKEASHVRG